MLFGEYAESIYAYMENTVNFGMFAENKIVSKYAEQKAKRDKIN
jgi:hypothetical protein